MKNTDKLILKNRARDLARESAENKVSSLAKSYLIFTLSGEIYGIETDLVSEVYPLRDFTPIPGMPSFIFGILNVRGQILGIVDLKKFFNLPERGLGELNKVIILRNNQMEFGILADVIHGTMEFSQEEILPAPLAIKGIGDAYLWGVTADQKILLNGETLLNDKKILIHQDAG